MATSTEDARRRARYSFDAADFEECLRIANEALSSSPDDVELLVLAGRAGVELDSEDAASRLQRATELDPGNANAWHHLGEALVTDGRTQEAEVAFRRAVELDPNDQVALSNLGHTALAAGNQEEGMGFLARASEIAHAASTAAISLVDMYRSFGQYENALAQAQKLVEGAPDDVLSWLDVAELSLQVGQFDEARAAFERIRDLDDVPGNEAYPVHGMIQIEIRCSEWGRAKELAAQAAAIDPQGVSTELLAFLEAQSGGASDPEGPAPPTAAEVNAALTDSLASYRRMLEDNRRLVAGEAE